MCFNYIFVQIRGVDDQPSVSISRITTDGLESNLAAQLTDTQYNPNHATYRENADCIVVYGTTLNHVSYRDIFTGSWVISILCEVFMNHAHDTDLLKLLHMVTKHYFIHLFIYILFIHFLFTCLVFQADDRLEKIGQSFPDFKQTIQFNWTGFNKELYLNPGLFKEP